MTIKVIDDFLDIDHLNHMQKIIMGYEFPWYFTDEVVEEHQLEPENKKTDNFQLTHIIFDDFRQKSSFFELMDPLIRQINPKSLIRIKINLLPKRDKIIKHGFHTDVDPDVNCVTAVYYLNTNNGFTEFSNGEIVNSLANRIVFFDSQIKHTGTTCTDKKSRIAINFNFF